MAGPFGSRRISRCKGEAGLDWNGLRWKCHHATRQHHTTRSSDRPTQLNLTKAKLAYVLKEVWNVPKQETVEEAINENADNYLQVTANE